MTAEEYSRKLKEKNLKVTPQRIAVIDAITNLHNHPSAENIIEYTHIKNPNISPATVYKILETFVACGLINRVTTERDIMRYDAIMESHHHLYCPDSDKIEDYKDEELNSLLHAYFEKKNIPNFQIKDLKLNIIGKYINQK